MVGQPDEAFIYNEFADALREGLRLGVIAARRPDDRRQSRARGTRKIGKPVDRTEAGRRSGSFARNRLGATLPRIIPKERWLDPPVHVNGSVQLLSTLRPNRDEE